MSVRASVLMLLSLEIVNGELNYRYNKNVFAKEMSLVSYDVGERQIFATMLF